MRKWLLIGSALLALILAIALLAGCGQGGKQAEDGDDSSASTVEGDTSSDGDGESPAVETEVTGLPPQFPADVPVHPGTVVDSSVTQVTDSITSYQIDVDTVASFDDVVAWYQDSLPAGWSVGYLAQDESSNGREAKIALDGGDYTPASPDGLGGGVLIGVFEGSETTRITTTVTDMGGE